MKTLLNRFCLVFLITVLFLNCQRSISWNFKATGTLKDMQGICFTPFIKGDFYNGVALHSDNNYVEVNVNVFAPGNYVVSTDIQNGLSFADSGVFNNIGIQTIKLKPIGTPAAIATTNFTMRFDTSVCSFSLNVKDSSLLHDSLNTWHYTDVNTGIYYHGIFNATYFTVTPSSGLLSLRQEVKQYGDSNFQIGIVYPTAEITTGTFTTDLLNNVSLSINGTCINCAWNVMYVLTGAIATIVVESYDTSTGIIKGSFYGSTVNWNNEIAPIKKGRFSALIKR